MYEDYFAKQLRQYRESQGWTLQEMADVLHTSKQVLSRYETGQRTPKISVANEFASILQVPLSYFMPSAPHWDDEIYKAWCDTPSECERDAIVQKYGLDPRIYSEYLHKIAVSSPIIPPFRITEHEKDLVFAYRANPAMQGAVDRLLGLDSQSESLPVPQPKNA